MAQGNTVTLVGNLTRDPELRFTPAGKAVATLGLAVNRRFQRQGSNEWEEQTSFFNVVCWEQLGENVAESLHKGDRIIVTGELQQRSWETDGGEKRSTVEVKADEIGPSMRWATASVVKNTRRAGDQAPPPEEPFVGSNGTKEPATVGAGAPVDEEPF